MKKFDSFYNKYSLSKTLRFSLIPEGETGKYIAEAIAEGNHKAEAYKRVKVMIDELHRDCISDILNKFEFSINELNGLYNTFVNLKLGKNDAKKEFTNRKLELIKNVKDFIAKYEPKPLNMKDKKQNKKIIIKGVITLLKERFNDENSQKDIEEFQNYTAYFSGYNTSRKHMYTNQIPYRVMHNLSEHINNVFFYEQIKDKILDSIKELNKELQVDADTIFNIRYFNKVLTQNDINKYNMLIAGKTVQAGVKIKGINEYINEYNSVHKQDPLPKLTQLYKQILSDIESESFRCIPIENEEELFEVINAYYAKLEKYILQSNELKELFKPSKISEYKFDKIYIKVRAIHKISEHVFQDGKFISAEMANKFGSNTNIKKIIAILENEENRKPKNDTIHLSWLKECLSEANFNKIMSYFDEQINNSIKIIEQKRKLYDGNQRSNIKGLLDTIKQLQYFISFFVVENIVDMDIKFYNTLHEKYEILNEFVSLYNKARNFITKKPYSLNKIKLNFYCPTLLDGWDFNKEEDNLSIILRKNESTILV